MKQLFISFLCISHCTLYVCAQVNDSNTPLHLMKPDYKTPYSTPKAEEVKAVIDRVFKFIDEATPAVVIDKTTQKEVANLNTLNKNAAIAQGSFRLTSYEWGVTYSSLLRASETTGDQKYAAYTRSKHAFLARVAPYFKRLREEQGVNVGVMHPVNYPAALDDAGAICTSVLKAQGEGLSLVPTYINFILNKEYRLSDGTFARNRPHKNSVWLDDMFMAIPAIAYYGKHTGDSKYYDEAARQIKLFAEKMWVSEVGLFRHGWIESIEEHLTFHWGRANGWAILTLCEVLDVLPANHPDRAFILDLYKKHVRGLAPLQDGDGFWHQLLNRQETYQETSCTAIYTYCIAHGINKGWLDAKSYGAIAQLGWNAITTKVTEKGEVTGTCVGTGMGFDAAFYTYRPVHAMAAHGYGPVILAGAEIIEMLRNTHPKSNDSAVMYYDKEQKSQQALFFEE